MVIELASRREAELVALQEALRLRDLRREEWLREHAAHLPGRFVKKAKDLRDARERDQ